MFFATLETSLFDIGGISAWYILNKRNSDFFTLSFKIVLAIAIAVTPLKLYIGHLSGEQVYHHQPTKLAAMEAQWSTIPAGTSPAWSAIALPNDKAEKNDWEISIPGLLSYILEIKPQLSEPVLGLKEYAPEDRPHQIGLIYYAFRIMIAISLCEALRDRFFLGRFDGSNGLTMVARKTITRQDRSTRLVVENLAFGCTIGLYCGGIGLDRALRWQTTLDGLWRNSHR